MARKRARAEFSFSRFSELFHSGRFIELFRSPVIRNALLQKVSAAIERNLGHLVRRRAQLVRHDPYGRINAEAWSKEVVYFLAKHIAPLLTKEELLVFEREREAFCGNDHRPHLRCRSKQSCVKGILRIHDAL
jgi:hypothetical protein